MVTGDNQPIKIIREQFLILLSKAKHSIKNCLRIILRVLLFPPYDILTRPTFLTKMPLKFSDFIIRIGVFLCYRVKNELRIFSGFCNPETSTNRTRYMIFSDYIIETPPKHPFSREKQFGLYNPNCISTNSKHVCNMDSCFRDNINLPNSHPSLLDHCYPFLVKNWVFELHDQIVPKLPQKIKKNSRTMTPVEGTSYGDSVHQNPKFHCLDPFFIF